MQSWKSGRDRTSASRECEKKHDGAHSNASDSFGDELQRIAEENEKGLQKHIYTRQQKAGHRSRKPLTHEERLPEMQLRSQSSLHQHIPLPSGIVKVRFAETITLAIGNISKRYRSRLWNEKLPCSDETIPRWFSPRPRNVRSAIKSNAVRLANSQSTNWCRNQPESLSK